MDVPCIADEQLAVRLAAIENDLVDAYVGGELSGDDLDRFKSSYRSSAYRRHKVDFATALLESEKKITKAWSPSPWLLRYPLLGVRYGKVKLANRPRLQRSSMYTFAWFDQS